MSIVLALDPGPFLTGVVVYETAARRVLQASVSDNSSVLQQVQEGAARGVDHLAVEMIASYGKSVGADVFNTCLWIGRYFQAWTGASPVELVYRADVKLMLCGSTAANDALVRQALISRFDGSGGGKVPQIGTQRHPGPLFGVSTHAWAALAVAIASAHGHGHVMSGAAIHPLHPDVHSTIRPIKK